MDKQGSVLHDKHVELGDRRRNLIRLAINLFWTKLDSTTPCSGQTSLGVNMKKRLQHRAKSG